FKRPDSLGIFYSMITQYLGFQRDSDEYKVMGLSGYGNAKYDFSWLLSNSDEGDYSLNTDYLRFAEDSHRTHPRQKSLYSDKFLAKLNNKPHRLVDMPIDDYYINVAKSAQEHLEKVALSLLGYLHNKTNSENLCL